MSDSFSFATSAEGLREISQDAVSPKEIQDDIDNEINAMTDDLGAMAPVSSGDGEGMNVDQEFDNTILTESLRKASAQVVVENTLAEYKRFVFSCPLSGILRSDSSTGFGNGSQHSASV